jgi:plastocyanin
MKRRTFLATAAGAGTAAVAGCLGAGSTGEYDVGMSHHSFLPAETEVTVGETVVWGNNGSRGHTVTAYEDGIPEDATYFASGGFESEAAARDAWRSGGAGNVAPGDRFSHTFEVPGTYSYVCIPHEPQGMVGTVRVVE